MEVGNPNRRHRFARGAREFAHRRNCRGPAHHRTVGVSPIADRLDKMGALPGLETIRLC